MYRRAARFLLNVSLLASAVGVVVTGLVSDQLDLNSFVIHSRIGYVMAVLAAVHVGLHWRYFARLRPTAHRLGGGVAQVTAPSSRAPDSIAAITHESQEGIGPAADPSDGGDRDLYPATAHQHVLPRRAALVSVEPPRRLCRRLDRSLRAVTQPV